MAANESQQQKRGDRWSKEMRAIPFILRHLWISVISRIRSWNHNFKKKKRGRVRSPRWHCEGWSRIVRSIHWTRIISFTNDSSKSHGYHIQTARLRRTSSRRSIIVYPSKNGRCSQIVEKNPKSECPDIWIRLPRHKGPKSWSSMEDTVVPLEQNLYGHPLAGLKWGRQFEKVVLGNGWEKVRNWESFFFNRERIILISVRVDAGKKQNLDPMWKILMKDVDLGEPTSFLDHVSLGCTQREWKISTDTVDKYRDLYESRISAGATKKLLCSGKPDADISSWSYDMERHAKKCVERYCELANKTTQQLHKVATPCVDDHQCKEEELGSVGELSKVSPQIVLKCLYLARIGRPDILWSINKLARAITKWTSMRQAFSTFDFLHSSHKWTQTILSCGKHNTAK